jgi:hypothetical protein
MARPAVNFHLQPKSGGYRARVLVPGRTTTETRQEGIQHTRLEGRQSRGGSARMAGSTEIRGHDREGQNWQFRPRRADGGTGTATASRADVQDSRDTQ